MSRKSSKKKTQEIRAPWELDDALFFREGFSNEYENIILDFYMRETEAAEAGGKDRLAGLTPEEFETLAIVDYLTGKAS